MSEKIIRVLVTAMVELKSELDVDQAIADFETNSDYKFSNTSNVEVLSTEWRETKKVSYREINKTGTQVLLKPLK